MVYCYHDDTVPLFALLIHGKSEQADPTPEQRKMVKSLLTAIKLQRLKKEQDPMSKFGDDLIDALREVLAHERGEPVAVVVHQVRVPDAVDVRAIRRRMKLSRREFAERFGLDARAVQEWEQGRRRPDRTARVLLRIIERRIPRPSRMLWPLESAPMPTIGRPSRQRSASRVPCLG